VEPIVALATPWGVGALHVIRISGDNSRNIVEAWRGRDSADPESFYNVSRVVSRDPDYMQSSTPHGVANATMGSTYIPYKSYDFCLCPPPDNSTSSTVRPAKGDLAF